MQNHNVSVFCVICRKMSHYNVISIINKKALGSNTCFNDRICIFYLFMFLVGFYVASTRYRSYGDFLALLVGGDFSCPFVHKRAQE
jgi:uncharacterized membrane protein YiaA